MKAVKIAGERQAELIDLPDPRAAGEFVVVKTRVVPMCTEYRAFRAGTVGHGLGHEAAGEVVEVAQPGKVKVGDRVVAMPLLGCGKCFLCQRGEYIHCQDAPDLAKETGYTGGSGTYAQYLLKPDWLLVPIPEGMSYEHASMACCGLGPSFGAMQLMEVDRFDTVLITGLGPVGLGAVVNAVYRGARVIGLESNPYRADLAKRLGAETVIDPKDPEAVAQIRALGAGGRGVGKAIECSGVGEAAEVAVKSLRRKGQAALVGGSAEFTLHGWQDIVSQGVTIHGAWHFGLADADRIMRVIAGSGPRLDQMITHLLPMARAQGAFELQLAGQCGKILLYPWP